MKKISPYVVLGLATAWLPVVVGCTANRAEESSTAKTQVAVQDNPVVPVEVKTEVAAAKQKEMQKMDTYAKEMSEKHKNNPPGIK